MISILLAIIYVAFISLGLPDSLLGSAWPEMQVELGVPMSYAGIVSMIIAIGTIVASLLSDRLTKKLGAGLVTAISVLLTALAMVGFALSRNFTMLCLLAIPYGLGAGAVDAALNNYVALHYSSRHMSWLHCFWGVGASISPYIMGFFLTKSAGWHGGYLCIGIIQMTLTAVLFLSLPLWKQKKAEDALETPNAPPKKLSEILRIEGVPFILLAFFGYCSLEGTAGMWASSYLVLDRGITTEKAAMFASFMYIGVTGGRLLCGFVANKIGDKNMIRIGLCLITLGVVLVMLPVNRPLLALIGLIVIGCGCAPVYPSIIHSTPYNFGKENSQALVGIQMACAYIGTATVPPLFGWIAEHVGIGIYPFFLMIFAVLMIVMTEALNRKLKKKHH